MTDTNKAALTPSECLQKILDALGIEDLNINSRGLFEDYIKLTTPAANTGDDREEQHKNDRYITTDDKKVYDRLRDRFVPDDELERVHPYEQMPKITDAVLEIFTTDEHPVMRDMAGKVIGYNYHLTFADVFAVRAALKAALAPRQVDVEALKREMLSMVWGTHGPSDNYRQGLVDAIDYLAERGLIEGKKEEQ